MLMSIPTFDQPTILAVDDNVDNLILLQYQLACVAPCTVITAIDGETAWTLAQRKRPDLILLDILLPDVNGLEVLSRIRSHAATANIPVIALTALARTEDRDRLLSAGCNDYLSKPYDLDDLATLIARHLPQHCRL